MVARRRHPARSPALVASPTRASALEHLEPARGPDDPRRQPRQPPRHRPSSLSCLPDALPPPHGRRRGGRLLLRPPLEGRALVLRPRRDPDGAHQGQPPQRRPRRRAASTTAGASSSSPRAAAAATAGARSSGAAPPTSPSAAACRSSRCTSVASRPCFPRAARASAGQGGGPLRRPAPPARDQRRHGATRTLGASPPASRRRWPLSPTRPRRDWWSARRRAAAGSDAAVPGARRSPRGAALGAARERPHDRSPVAQTPQALVRSPAGTASSPEPGREEGAGGGNRPLLYLDSQASEGGSVMSCGLRPVCAAAGPSVKQFQ